LETDVAFGRGGDGLIDQDTIHRACDVAALAGDDGFIPLTVGLLGIAFAQGCFPEERSFHPFQGNGAEQVAEIAFPELELDSVRPHLVIVRQAVEDTAVGPGTGPAPLQVQGVVSILFDGADVAERLSGDVQGAVHDRERGLRDRTVLPGEEHPSVEVLSVEQHFLPLVA